MLRTIESWLRRFGMELVLSLLATVVFLGFLGSVDLWGKREQRASAEALDTVDHQHWLVAQIQGRPRLEKPPLPRWTIAALVSLTGRRDEWIVRLPSGLAALGMVALVYALGCRLGGRSVGLSSGLVLTSLGFFISELRQAGNDGPLALFTTLALYAAWRRLHGNGEGVPGERRWSLLLYLALGLGFLTKGPIIVLLVLVALIPYLFYASKLRSGIVLLADGWGFLLFLVISASWPIPVMLRDPNAFHVWYLEMGQKTGSAGFSHYRHHQILAGDWPSMTVPWLVLAFSSALLPFLPRAKAYRPMIWFPWFWAIGNLAMFCLWRVAKPNYYLPCIPGVALLIGIEWVRLTQLAREQGVGAAWARRALQLHWVAPFVVGAVAPVVVGQLAPQYFVWTSLLSLAVIAASVASAWSWRRGADAGAMIPLVAAWALGITVLYGAVAPELNARRSHRDLAMTLDRILPSEARTVMFLQELDEGLWFYLQGRTLAPVPGSQPQYNKGFDLYRDYHDGQLELDTNKRIDLMRQAFLKWAAVEGRKTSYVLVRKRLYDALASSLVGLVEPLHTEKNLDRHELVLLRVNPSQSLATRPPEKPTRQ